MAWPYSVLLGVALGLGGYLIGVYCFALWGQRSEYFRMFVMPREALSQVSEAERLLAVQAKEWFFEVTLPALAGCGLGFTVALASLRSSIWQALLAALTFAALTGMGNLSLAVLFKTAGVFYICFAGASQTTAELKHLFAHVRGTWFGPGRE